MLSVTIIGGREFVARFGRMPSAVRTALDRKVRALAIMLEARVKEKLSGEVLNVRSGDLRRSIHHEVESDAGGTTGRVFSSGDVKYAAIHEFGGKINIPEIFPVNAKALHFFVGAKEIFAARVKAHTVTMPERSYLRSALDEKAEEIKAGLAEAVGQAVTGRR